MCNDAAIAAAAAITMVTSVVLPAPLASRLCDLSDSNIAVLAGVWSDETLHVVGSLQGCQVDATAGACGFVQAITHHFYLRHHLSRHPWWRVHRWGGLHNTRGDAPSDQAPHRVCHAPPRARSTQHLSTHTASQERLVALCPQDASLHAHALVAGALVASGPCVAAPTATVAQQLGRTWFTSAAAHHLDVVGDAWVAAVQRLASAINVDSNVIGMMQVGLSLRLQCPTHALQVDGGLRMLDARQGGPVTAPTPVQLFAAASHADDPSAAPSLTAMPIKGTRVLTTWQVLMGRCWRFDHGVLTKFTVQGGPLEPVRCPVTCKPSPPVPATTAHPPLPKHCATACAARSSSSLRSPTRPQCRPCTLRRRAGRRR